MWCLQAQNALAWWIGSHIHDPKMHRSTEHSKMPGPYMGLYRESDACKIVLGCTMHWYALKCMSEALNILMGSGDAEFCEMHQSWKLQWLKSICSICCWLLGQSWHSRRPATGASTTHVELRLKIAPGIILISRMKRKMHLYSWQKFAMSCISDKYTKDILILYSLMLGEAILMYQIHDEQVMRLVIEPNI